MDEEMVLCAASSYEQKYYLNPVEHNEGDFSFDEIGSVLKIKELQDTKEELFKSLEMFYKVFYLGEEMEEETEE